MIQTESQFNQVIIQLHRANELEQGEVNELADTITYCLEYLFNKIDRDQHRITALEQTTEGLEREIKRLKLITMILPDPALSPHE